MVRGDGKPRDVPTAQSVCLHDQGSEHKQGTVAQRWRLCNCPPRLRAEWRAMLFLPRRLQRYPSYREFTSQDELGHFLLDHYKIRTPKDLTSCEVCHR